MKKILSLFLLLFSLTTIAQDISELKNHRVLIVGGMLNELNLLLAKMLKPYSFLWHGHVLDSFYYQIEWLEENAIDYEYVDIDTERSCSHNASIIAERIFNSPLPVILLTHSKGGVDTLHALIKNPQAQKNVAGWVALFAPFYGTSLANIEKTFHLKLGVVQCLESDYRLNYAQKHQFTLETLTKQIPILSVAGVNNSRKRGENLIKLHKGRPYLNRSFFGISGKFLKLQEEGISDGVVSVESACLKGTKCVLWEGTDHFSAVMDLYPLKSLSPEKQKKMTERLFSELLFLKANFNR